METIPPDNRLDVMTYLPQFSADIFEKYGIKVELTEDDIANAPLWFAGAVKYGIESGALPEDILKSTKDYTTKFISWTDDDNIAWKQLHTVNEKTGDTVHKWGSPVKSGTASTMFYYDPQTDTIISASGLDADKMVSGLVDGKASTRLKEVRTSALQINKVTFSLLNKLATSQAALKVPNNAVGGLISLWEGLADTSKAALGSWFASDESRAVLQGQIPKGLTFNGEKISSLEQLQSVTGLDTVLARMDKNDPDYKLISNAKRLIGDRASIYSDIITLGFAIANAREPGKLTDKDIAYALRTVGFDETRSFISPIEFASGLVNGVALINDKLEFDWTEGFNLEERYSLAERMKLYNITDIRHFQSGNTFFPEGSEENLFNMFGLTGGTDGAVVEQGTKATSFDFEIPKTLSSFFKTNPGVYGYKEDKTAIKPFNMWPEKIKQQILNLEDKQLKNDIWKWIKAYQMTQNIRKNKRG